MTYAHAFAETQLPQEAGAPPLVDPNVLRVLGTAMPVEEFDALIQLAMSTYQDTLGRMLDPMVPEGEVRSEAQRLVGAAGHLGFKRLSRLAERIEAAGAAEHATLLRDLADSIGATQQELASLGLPA
jgi:HPt (histidine-containing phosphotransfer) domain-containing protein